MPCLQRQSLLTTAKPAGKLAHKAANPAGKNINTQGIAPKETDTQNDGYRK